MSDAYAKYLAKNAMEDALRAFLVDDLGIDDLGARTIAAEVMFSDWLARVRREAKVEALREAAGFTIEISFRFDTLADVRDWLRARADRLDAEAGEPKRRSFDDGDPTPARDLGWDA